MHPIHDSEVSSNNVILINYVLLWNMRRFHRYMLVYVSSDSRLNQVIFSCRKGDNSQMLDTTWKMLVFQRSCFDHTLLRLFKYICTRRNILGTVFFYHIQRLNVLLLLQPDLCGPEESLGNRFIGANYAVLHLLQ